MVKQLQKIECTHGGSTNEVQTANLITDVYLRENKGSNATLSFINQNNLLYPSVIDQEDVIKISFKNATDANYTQVFGGYADELTPSGSMTGVTLPVKCVGYDIALDRMRVANEYGVESKNYDLTTLLDILTDADEGIITKFCHKVLKSSLDSGYTFNTNYILDETTDLNYVPLPYTPINDSLKTLLDLITAATAPDAGLHWFVVPDGTTAYLCIDQIGNHTTAAAKWPTYCPVSIVIGENVVSSSYGKQAREASYVVYCGKYEYPTGEIATENAATNWTYASGTAASSKSDDTSDYKVGANSTYFNLGVLGGGSANSIYQFPTNSLDVTKFGTRRTPPTLSFYVKYRVLSALKIIVGTGTPITNYYQTTINLPTSDKWGHIELSLGNYLKPGDEDVWTVGAGSPSWSDIDYVGFDATWAVGDNRLWLDGLFFNGIVTRGAYYSNVSHHKIKVVTDSLAKTSSLVAADDSNAVAQLAKAELLRSLTTPIQGTIVLNQIYPTIQPGQIINDLSLRITEVHFHFAGDNNSYTELTVTDDVLNSYPQENTTFGPTAQYNTWMMAVNPDFQDRDRGNLKARDIDIEQAILAKDYYVP